MGYAALVNINRISRSFDTIEFGASGQKRVLVATNTELRAS